MIAKVIRGTVSEIRSAILRFRNGRAAAECVRAIPADRIPSFIVVTPEVVHLAPLAAMNHGVRILPVFVTNGATQADEAWLRGIAPGIPVLSLTTSLRSTSGSLLHHGEVIDILAQAMGARNFVLQDADCFVTDEGWWASLDIDASTEYASGPFARRAEEGQVTFPETFLLLLNGSLLERLRVENGIVAAATERPRRIAAARLAKAGFPKGKYLETRKNYFDTLQQYWAISLDEGFVFRRIPGDGEAVHHVGGTSYLHRTFDDLAHWDYWPLNVHYFHLRLLELAACAQFRGRFSTLMDFHGSSAKLLERYPDYARGRRRAQSDTMIARTSAESLYGGAGAER